MDLFDPDFGNCAAPNLLNSLERITKPLFLRLLVIYPDLYLPTCLNWLLHIHVWLGTHEKWLISPTKVTGMPSLAQLPWASWKVGNTRYESSR